MALVAYFVSTAPNITVERDASRRNRSRPSPQRWGSQKYIMRFHTILGLLFMFIFMNAYAQDPLPPIHPMNAFYKELVSIPEGSCAEPKYTETPRALEEVGVVKLQFEISAEGKTKSVQALNDLGNLSALSLRYLSGCMFPAAILAGKPVSSQIIVPVEWKLDGVTNPIIQVNDACRPQYPISARRRQANGTTKLIVRVSETNEILDVSISRPSGHSDLDQEAIKAIKRCKAIAGTSRGVQKEKNTIVTIDWRRD